MQKGKPKTIRDDEVLKVRERRFKKPDDPTVYVAQVTIHKKPSKLFPAKKELWIGYYTSTGTQMGLGFFKKKSEVPKEFRPAFTGLDIRVRQRKRR